jgi:hypothetical protein
MMKSSEMPDRGSSEGARREIGFCFPNSNWILSAERPAASIDPAREPLEVPTILSEYS